MVMVQEILDLLSGKQNIEIRFVPDSNFMKAQTVIKGNLKTINYKTIKNLEKMEVIGLTSAEDFLWIYIGNP